MSMDEGKTHYHSINNKNIKIAHYIYNSYYFRIETHILV